MVSINVNGTQHELDVPAEMPLLWVVRDVLNLTGTKFGCGIGECGCCTMHVDGVAQRTCILPVSAAAGKQIHTIESLSPDNSNPVQQAWIAEQVPQCGYCQSGMLMAAAALLKDKPRPTVADINAAMTNLCRCGTYPRVKRAILRASSSRGDGE